VLGDRFAFFFQPLRHFFA
jgi:hypothetical protein